MRFKNAKENCLKKCITHKQCLKIKKTNVIKMKKPIKNAIKI